MVDWEAFESQAIDHQMKLVNQKFGTNQQANWGWAVDEQPDCLVISTKVYSDPIRILTTMVMADGSMSDDWMEY